MRLCALFIESCTLRVCCYLVNRTLLNETKLDTSNGLLKRPDTLGLLPDFGNMTFTGINQTYPEKQATQPAFHSACFYLSSGGPQTANQRS